jgi:hypothetical protein
MPAVPTLVISITTLPRAFYSHQCHELVMAAGSRAAQVAHTQRDHHSETVRARGEVAAPRDSFSASTPHPNLLCCACATFNRCILIESLQLFKQTLPIVQQMNNIDFPFWISHDHLGRSFGALSARFLSTMFYRLAYAPILHAINPAYCRVRRLVRASHLAALKSPANSSRYCSI